MINPWMYANKTAGMFDECVIGHILAAIRNGKFDGDWVNEGVCWEVGQEFGSSL